MSCSQTIGWHEGRLRFGQAAWWMTGGARVQHGDQSPCVHQTRRHTFLIAMCPPLEKKEKFFFNYIIPNASAAQCETSQTQRPTDYPRCIKWAEIIGTDAATLEFKPHRCREDDLAGCWWAVRAVSCCSGCCCCCCTKRQAMEVGKTEPERKT